MRRLIVPAPHTRGANGEFPNFLNGMYLGGHIRLEAAAKMAQQVADLEINLVGGYNKTGEGDPYASDKVRDMAQFITGHCKTANIKELPSLPCTHHNFAAVFNYWSSQNLEIDEVDILTNGCFIARTEFLAIRALSQSGRSGTTRFNMISAEDVLGRSIESIVAGHEDEYAARLELEQQGLADLYSGQYVDSCLTRDLPQLGTVIDSRAGELLTATELLSLDPIRS